VRVRYHCFMRSWQVFVGITMMLVVACLAEAAGGDSVQPNIVLLVTDDQRHDTIGFLHPVLETPNMDYLADAGVWFSNAFATTPICSASRATMLTGLHERTHGYGFGGSMPLAMLEKSFPALLRGAGYVTGFIGKNGTGLDEVRQQLLYDYHLQVNQSPYIQMREGELIHASDYMANKAAEFIAAQSATKPFLLEVAFHAPHAEDGDPRQFIPPERFTDLYQGIDHPDPPLSDPAFFNTLPIFLQEILNRTRWFWRWTPELSDGMMSSYLAMIHGVDVAVGEILVAVDDHGFSDNTVVILIGDNGAFIGERGYAGKWLAYDPSIRIPLIISDQRAGALRGRMVEEISLNLDLPETILDLAGVEIPAAMQGHSLAPFLRGEQPTWRTDTFLEHSWTRPPQVVIARHESLRTDHLKYIHYVDHGREELYDLRTDPNEATNLADDPAWSAELGHLRDRTVELRKLYAGLVFKDGFESGDLAAWTVVN
jgi:arylsulfatase A-like enzyme